MSGDKIFAFLPAFALIAAPSFAQAFEAVLVDDARPTRIQIMPLSEAGIHDRYVIAWDGLGTDPAHGAMVFSKDTETAESRYFAVGGGGPFSIVDRHGYIHSEGSDVPAVNVVVDDPAHPRLMKVGKEKIDSNAVMLAYRNAEGLGEAADTEATIESAVGASLRNFNTACGGNASVRFSWAQFEKEKQLPIAKEASVVIEGIGQKCSDASFKEALGKIFTFVISYNESTQDLSFKKSGASIEVKLHRAGFNPKERARLWITEEL